MSWFHEKMSSSEAQRVFFDYVSQHRGENLDLIKEEYQKISRIIIRRETRENEGKLTSYPFV